MNEANIDIKHVVTSTEAIVVLGETVHIHMTDDLRVDDQYCEGVFYLSRRAIYLENRLCNQPDRLERVRAHEIMHAYLGISGLAEMLDPKMEEAICVLTESMNIH